MQTGKTYPIIMGGPQKKKPGVQNNERKKNRNMFKYARIRHYHVTSVPKCV